MKKIKFTTILLLSILAFNNVNAQESKIIEPEKMKIAITTPLYDIENCTTKNLDQCSANNISTYISKINVPDNLEESCRATVRFIVNENGAVEDIKITRKCNNEYLNRLIIRHIQKMPAKWTPAKDEQGSNIKSEMKLPINFVL